MVLLNFCLATNFSPIDGLGTVYTDAVSFIANICKQMTNFFFTSSVLFGVILSLLSYFFVKKIPLSRRVEYVMDGSMDQ